MTDSGAKDTGLMTEDEILEVLDFDRIPGHICIIMDGNRRWAKSRNQPPFQGHRKGVEAFRRAMTACCELGVKVLTVYAFSMENWRRTGKEVEVLMSLFVEYCKSEKKLLKEMEVEFKVLGHIPGISKKVRDAFDEISEYTKGGSRMVANLCVNYGSRFEILEAARCIARDAVAGRIDPESLDETMFSNYLYTAGLPDPDLMIRTSGELRISNFLLWQNAYSEFWFTEKYWPDFDKCELLRAILDYQKRDRRFGGGAVKVEKEKQ